MTAPAASVATKRLASMRSPRRDDSMTPTFGPSMRRFACEEGVRIMWPRTHGLNLRVAWRARVVILAGAMEAPRPSRRQFLERGLGFVAGLAVAAPTIGRVGSFAGSPQTARSKLRRPGSLPHPRMPAGTDTI